MFKKATGLQVKLSENAEGSVELNQNMLCAYMLSKGENSGMTEGIKLELLENDEGAIN